MNNQQVIARLKQVPGEVGFFYKNLVTGETLGLREDDLFESASVIKFPVYAIIMKLAAEGKVDLYQTLTCRNEDKLRSCGALHFFTDEPKVTIKTLCSLMITISDNTATNMLISHFGIDFLNGEFKKIGLEKTHIERLLFRPELAKLGYENRICPREMCELLEKIYRHTYVSEQVSLEMETLLKKQQVNHKIPGYLRGYYDVAHKTGEDDNLSNDVGVVYAEEPFAIAFCTYHTNVPEAERAMREITLGYTNLPPWRPEE